MAHNLHENVAPKGFKGSKCPNRLLNSELIDQKKLRCHCQLFFSTKLCLYNQMAVFIN